jgi:hypothetical protein
MVKRPLPASILAGVSVVPVVRLTRWTASVLLRVMSRLDGRMLRVSLRGVLRLPHPFRSAASKPANRPSEGVRLGVRLGIRSGVRLGVRLGIGWGKDWEARLSSWRHPQASPLCIGHARN